MLLWPDAKNSGQFVDCVSDYTVPIHGAWWDGLHLGITASTGQLADNHDILAVETVAGDAPGRRGPRERNARPVHVL